MKRDRMRSCYRMRPFRMDAFRIYDMVKANYLMPYDLKKIDIGGG